ncbi:MAG: type II toxin-antitoxin system VapC family toxin [Thermoanaerobaculia bacterium]|nr:type II toxin-antitoxin system VapC family toxin [Thermoanaerobaculia bacterium]
MSGDPRAAAVSRKIEEWLESGEELHAPSLTPFEIANALTRLVTGGLFPPERISEAVAYLAVLPVTYHSLELSQAGSVAEIALGLQRRSAYDAAYLKLGEDLDAEVWTLDGKLFRNASQKGWRVRRLVNS